MRPQTTGIWPSFLGRSLLVFQMQVVEPPLTLPPDGECQCFSLQLWESVRSSPQNFSVFAPLFVPSLEVMASHSLGLDKCLDGQKLLEISLLLFLFLFLWHLAFNSSAFPYHGQFQTAFCYFMYLSQLCLKGGLT